MSETNTLFTPEPKTTPAEPSVSMSRDVNATYPVDKRPEGITTYLMPGTTGMAGKLDMKESSVVLTLHTQGNVESPYRNITRMNGITKLELAYSDIARISMSWAGMLELHVKEPQNIAGFAFNSSEIEQIINHFRNKNVLIEQSVSTNGKVVSRSFDYSRILKFIIITLILFFLGFVALLIATNGNV